jgi:hypothetical protein
MELKRLLKERKAALVKRWLEVTLESYPPETARFFNSQRDQFANPVGHTLSQGLETIVDGLLNDKDVHAIISSLDTLVKVRAVQDQKPSQSLAFVLDLKGVVRNELGPGMAARFADELSELETAIDALALFLFDAYMKCRESIYDLKVKEFKRMTNRLLKLAKITCEIPDRDLEDISIDTTK